MAQFLAQVWEVLTRRIDSFLLGIALSIAGVGLITLFSASDQSLARITSQAASLGFALMLMCSVGRTPGSSSKSPAGMKTIALSDDFAGALDPQTGQNARWFPGDDS